MTMTVSDIGSALLKLDDDASRSEISPLAEGHERQWTLVSVPAGGTWSSSSTSSTPLHLLALEGFATCEDAEGRQSIGSGHLVILDGESPLKLINEENIPFRAVLASAPNSANGGDE